MNTEDLSELGKFIIDNRDDMLELWKKNLKEELDEAKELSDSIIVNTLPSFIDNLAEAISPKHARDLMTSNNTLAEEHGGERARSTNYNHATLIKEFQILRRSIFQFFKEKKKNVLENEAIIIHNSIDDAVLKSASAFSLMHAEIRDQVIATLGHDMRSPLTAASLATELLIKKSKDPELKTLAERIKSNHRRIDGMLLDLLNTTLIKSGTKLTPRISEFDVFKLTKEIIKDLPPEQQQIIKISGKNVVVQWDEDLIRRALENLISNALKYGDHTKGITIKEEECQGRFIFSIHNSGTAIELQDLETIFQIFKRARDVKDKRQGWGLGLPLVRAVAEAHGGSVIVESSHSTGTTFLLDIPTDPREFIRETMIK